MKRVEEKIPLLLRRLAGPVMFAAAVTGIVLLLKTFNIPTVVETVEGKETIERNYGGLAIGIAVAFLLVRILDYLLFDLAFRLRRQVVAPALLRQLVGLLFLGFCAAVLFNQFLSVQLTTVLATSAVLTVVIGLALQDTLGNLFSGLALHLEKTVAVGDMVRASETFGTVEELTWRAIKLRTMEGNILLIPNSVASRERLEIFRRPGRPVARTLQIGLEYEIPPAAARAALEEAAKNLPGIAAHPEPVAYLKKFADFAITYELRYWLEDYARYLEIDSQIRERVWYKLDRENLKIAYPLIRQHQWTAGPLERPSRREEVSAAVAQAELFQPLSPEERERVAQGARERRYAPGEIIVREGEKSSSMFLVESGRVAVSIHGAAGDSHKLAMIEPGSAFGEISLLTGEPRTATVRAVTAAVLIEIDKPTLSPILEENPSLVESLGAVMRERRQKAADLYDVTREEMEKTPDRTVLGGRIARFFGLKVRG